MPLKIVSPLKRKTSFPRAGGRAGRTAAGRGRLLWALPSVGRGGRKRPRAAQLEYLRWNGLPVAPRGSAVAVAAGAPCRKLPCSRELLRAATGAPTVPAKLPWLLIIPNPPLPPRRALMPHNSYYLQEAYSQKKKTPSEIRSLT